MAQQITRLLPNRSINEHDVINEYSLNVSSGEAGTFVKVVAANLTDDPVAYVNRGAGSFLNSLGNATSQYPEVPYKVGAVSGTGDGGAILGMLLRDVRTVDENGENLLYYPQKREELQCLVSGEAVPIATRGKVTVNSRAFVNGVAPAINDLAVVGANGQLTGVPFVTASTQQKNASVGKFIATGFRTSQQDTDAFAGPYAVLQFSL